MITIEFSEEDKAALDYERYHHPHPFLQHKMEALWLKSQRLPHKHICRLTNVCSTALTNYIPPYSSNLNLIERLWKFVKKKCLSSIYYKDFGTFQTRHFNLFGTNSYDT